MITKTLPLIFLGVAAASCLANAASSVPSLKATRWVNSPPVTAEMLRGKIVRRLLGVHLRQLDSDLSACQGVES
jgi:hypothetical protein